VVSEETEREAARWAAVAAAVKYAAVLVDHGTGHGMARDEAEAFMARLYRRTLKEEGDARGCYLG